MGRPRAVANRRVAVGFDELLLRRLLLLTGKGGVGKTTVAAALAVASARRGKRVVLCEVEGANQLGPLFETGPLSHEPRTVVDGIALAALSDERGIRAYLSERIRVPGVVDLVFKQPPVARFFRAAPAFSEMGVLYAILRLLEREGWDQVIVDLPASGHALGLLDAPSEGKKIFRAGPVRALCESVEKVLLDPATTAHVVVTLPEELPATEAAELASQLEARGFPLEAVVVNARERAPLADGEAAVLEGLETPAFRPLIEAARAGAARADRGDGIVRKLGERLARPPLSLSFHPAGGARLVDRLADEMLTSSVLPS